MRIAKLGKPAATKGIPRPQMRGKNHPNWKGGKMGENHLIRQSIEYRNWRMLVLGRDRFSCVNCGHRSKYSIKAGYKKCDIRVDHIKPFSLYPELRFEVSNGRTLCVPCDKILGWNYKRESTKSNKK